MEFIFQVSFTGLGVIVIHKHKKAPHDVKGVELLLVNTPANSDLHHHLPRLTFEIDDLAKTGEDYLNDAHYAANGAHEIELDLSKQDLTLQVTGRSSRYRIKRARHGAKRPGHGASEDAIDWIPDVEADLGIPDLIRWEDSLKKPYIARVTLPAGNVSSRRLFLNQNGTLAEFTFGGGAARVLVESMIWTRRVTGVKIPIGKSIWLDPQLRVQRGDAALVRLAITNLPIKVEPKRYGPPGHYHMFHMVSTSDKPTPDAKPVTAAPTTPDAGCPPARTEVYG